MAKKVKMKCTFCGRTFFKGQGVEVLIGDEKFYFHSKACALKFFKMLMERIPPEVSVPAAKSLARELAEVIKKREEMSMKKF
jgi:ribosomal protein L24E